MAALTAKSGTGNFLSCYFEINQYKEGYQGCFAGWLFYKVFQVVDTVLHYFIGGTVAGSFSCSGGVFNP